MKHTKLNIPMSPVQLRHYADMLEQHGKLEISWYYTSVVFVNEQAVEHPRAVDGDYWVCSHCGAENILFHAFCGVCSYPHPRR